MRSDYGYIEDNKLGKAYSFSLIKRIFNYLHPYRKMLSAVILATLTIAVIDLSFPYFSKIAIDRYILADWVEVTLSKAEIENISPAVKKYSHGDSYFLPRWEFNKIELMLKDKDGFSCSDGQFYYHVSAKYSELAGKINEAIFMPDGSSMIPKSALKNISPEDYKQIRSNDIAGVTWIGLLFFLCLIMSFILGITEQFFMTKIGQSMMTDIRLHLFSRITAQSVSFFERNPVGKLVNRVTNDIENLNELFNSVIIAIAKDLLILIGIIVIMIKMNAAVAVLCFICVPFIIGIANFFSRMTRAVFHELRETISKLNVFLQENFSGISIVQLFSSETIQINRFAYINMESFRAGMAQVKVFALFMPLMELIGSVALASLIWFGGGKVIEEQLTLGTLVAFIGYMQLFFKPIRDLSEKYNIMQAAVASGERIFEFIDKNEETPEPIRPIMPSDLKGRLEFNNVSFAYEKGKTVLHEVSFVIEPGKTVAIVGATGSGKTTLVSLLERFYDPNIGSISIDGIDIRNLSLYELRRNIGIVTQDIFIFSNSVEENISLGSELIPHKNILEAAEKINILPFIEKLPDGFKQILGESGNTLSAGQRQLLALTRCMAYDPKILILDEATSSIDPETERVVQNAIRTVSSNRTTLIIAHRPATIINSDRILVLFHGRVVEDGNHVELINKKGIYYNLMRQSIYHNTL